MAALEVGLYNSKDSKKSKMMVFVTLDTNNKSVRSPDDTLKTSGPLQGIRVLDLSRYTQYTSQTVDI